VGCHLREAAGTDLKLAHRQARAKADEANLGGKIARLGIG
jgi:hypothetical protein